MTMVEETKHKRGFFATLWYWWFRSMGWKAAYHDPGYPSYVVIVWPHTSNLDFFIGFIFSRAYPMPYPHFLAKDSAFRGLAGWILRRIGGVPVDRSQRTNFVDQVAEQFQANEQFVLAITPEGTRKKTPYWKSGFYHIAMAAHVPIVMATFDYRLKFLSFGSWIMPTGDMEADMTRIRENYAGAQGRHPERQGEIRLRESEIANPAETSTPVVSG